MRFRARIPRLLSSSVDTGPEKSQPVLDGRDVTVPNRWNLPQHTVALIGRPAVWVALDITTPRIALGFIKLAAQRIRLEQDFGGHLFLAIVDSDTSRASVIEAGPIRSGSSGALVPYAYPEDDFAKRGILDFEPIVIEPPLGLTADSFAELIRSAQRAYDGDQRYLVVELPFLRIGRDSNSYAVGVLLACGIDPRAVPKPNKALRFEITGYPGAEDPVHRANFGSYSGKPGDLGNGVTDLAVHDADGSVRYVLIGGEPHGRARLPDGTDVELDALGRRVFSPDDARARGLPSSHTDPPEQIVNRRIYPEHPAPSGAQITLVVGGRSVPMQPGKDYTGTIAARHDALGIATLRTDSSDVVLPLTELGVELRDPERTDRLIRVGSKLTVGLHRDRRPKLILRGGTARDSIFGARRFHAPPWSKAIPLTVFGIATVGGLLFWRARTG